jgi:hypothetical protein
MEILFRIKLSSSRSLMNSVSAVSSFYFFGFLDLPSLLFAVSEKNTQNICITFIDIGIKWKIMENLSKIKSLKFFGDFAHFFGGIIAVWEDMCTGRPDFMN